MANTKPESLEKRVLQRIKRQRRAVFLRDDFSDLGGYDQVGRVLRILVGKGQLMRMGYGVYNKTRRSILDGTMLPARSIDELAGEALGRLGIGVAPTQIDLDYAAGRTTQVPSGRQIGVTGRIRRKLQYNSAPLSYERARSPRR